MAKFPDPCGESGTDREEPSGTAEAELTALRARVSELEQRVEALQESEARYISLLQQGKEGIWRIEHLEPISTFQAIDLQIDQVLETGVLSECNDAMAAMYGAESVEEMTGKRVRDLFDAESARTRSFLRAFIVNGYSLNDVESEERDLAGNPKWFLNSLVGVIEDGHLIGAWGSQRDVTESHRAARQYRFQQSFLRSVIDSLPSPVFVKDQRGTYVLANRALAELYGTDVETLEGKVDDDFRTPEESQEYRLVDKAVLESGSDRGPYLLRMERPDGVLFLYETTKRRIPGYEPGEWYVLGVCNDVTEREQTAQERLKIRQAIDFASDAITITDLDGFVTYANPAFERLTNYAVEELREIGGPRKLYLSDSELQHVLTAINDQGFFEGEVSMMRKDGGSMVVNQRIDLIRDQSGAPISIICLRTDVSDKKRLESQLRQTEKLAALGELIAGVAHELNNPLATISAHAQLLLRFDQPAINKRAEGILRMVDRASRIGKSLLTFARNSRTDTRRHPLNGIVAEALELCRSKLKREGVQLETDLDPSDPAVFVDESQIEQIIVNLINNAAYAMRDSEERILEIRTFWEGDNAFLSVCDRGGGIPEEVKARVFEPFFTTKPMGEGTGLGLSICHGLAEANGGMLVFRDRNGGGTIFSLTLPLAEAATQSGGM